MDKLHVIAVEMPTFIFYNISEPVKACVYANGNIYIYNQYRELLSPKKYGNYINTIRYTVKEGKYQWSDFYIDRGQQISLSFDFDVLVDEKMIDLFRKPDLDQKRKISDKTLKLFNQFLRKANRDNPDMVKALELSYRDGFFRKEVEEIVRNDEIDTLSDLDKEIIVRTKIEGIDYIKRYVEEMLGSENPEKYLDINYFFRRLFNLEIFKYISLEV